MAIDTLKVARGLREAGFNEAQAEALVAAVQAGAEGGDLATRADLGVLRGEIATLAAELRAEIAAVKAEIAAVGADIKSEMMMRMLQMVLGAVLVNIVAMLGVMFAFAKLLGH